MEKTVPHLYLIGIGGVGMVWIADYALSKGWQVSGSDLTTSPLTERLQQAGAQIHIGVNPELIPEGVSEAIITSAITERAPHYPEYQALLQKGVPILKRAVWIGKLTRSHYTLAVAGAHGKTTTTAMLGWILAEAGLDPTVFVGGTVAAWGATRVGNGPYLVIEADEYDRSFHQFYPQLAILLNIDKDHTDYYQGGLPEIEQSFRRFLHNLPSKVHASPYGVGKVIGYGRDKLVRKVVRGFKFKFRWYDQSSLWPGLKLLQPGNHLKLNATAAAKAAHELGIESAVIQKALATFPGVGRRFEYLGRWGEQELYSDYAHHPAEVAATLQAVREKWPQGTELPVTLVFQPHQKARTRELLTEFSQCFKQHSPDRLILTEIYSVAGREDGIAVTISDLGAKLKPVAGMELEVIPELEQLEARLRQLVQTPGILIMMGAGSIHGLAIKWSNASQQPH